MVPAVAALSLLCLSRIPVCSSVPVSHSFGQRKRRWVPTTQSSELYKRPGACRRQTEASRQCAVRPVKSYPWV